MSTRVSRRRAASWSSIDTRESQSCSGTTCLGSFGSFFIKDLDTGESFPVADADAKITQFNYVTFYANSISGISLRSVGTGTARAGAALDPG